MKLSRAQRQKLLRFPSQLVNEGKRTGRIRLKRDQSHQVGDFLLTLPPEHDLPYYQRRDPTYDSYAIDVLAKWAVRAPQTLVVDLGGNVGDTAASALSAGPSIRVISIEGSPHFAKYWRLNARNFGGRAELVEGFVGVSDRETMEYRQDRGSGGFQASNSDSGTLVDSWVSLESIFAQAHPAEQLIFKSDIDGLDIHVLANNWRLINDSSDVIWCEFDPARTLGDRGDIERFITYVQESGRPVTIYDNLGRLMLEMDPGPHIGAVLRSLTQWLTEVHRGYLTVPYLDLWLGPIAESQE